MTRKVTKGQRTQICELLEQKHARDAIAEIVGVTPSQVSAVAAHMTMGTYDRTPQPDRDTKSPAIFASTLQQSGRLRGSVTCEDEQGILLGYGRSGASLHWDPINSVNPHVLVVGESGFGKTYSISCLIAELSKRGIPSIIFDYGQGFTASSSDESLVKITKPTQLQAARDGIQISPFEIFPSDLHGPLNVAQRVSDTLSRVYKNIGIQQHSVIRGAIIDVLGDAGIHNKARDTWSKPLPRFGLLEEKLQEYADDFSNSDRKTPRTAASHISSLFIFNIFRKDGTPVKWDNLLHSDGRPTVIQLMGIEQDLQQAVTEFMVWNLIGFIESSGPAKLRCFVVIDEAHRMVSGPGSAIDKLLREGRKFGIGVILASQQPEDFTPVAFSNTATKLIFQISDDNSAVSKRLYRKLHMPIPFSELYTTITTLPRGEAFAITNNHGAVIKFTSFMERFASNASHRRKNE